MGGIPHHKMVSVEGERGRGAKLLLWRIDWTIDHFCQNPPPPTKKALKGHSHSFAEAREPLLLFHTPSIFNITEALDDSPLLPEDYRTKANALRAHFYPIEIDPSLTIEQKIPLMVEWWTGGHNLLIEHRCLNRNKLREIVAGAKLYLRLVWKVTLTFDPDPWPYPVTLKDGRS